MRAGRLTAVVAGLMTVGSCVFPTERDSAVHVSLSPLHILFRGSDTVASAQAWQMTGPKDSIPIPNVVFVWSSSDPSIATVSTGGHVVGVKSGTVVITAAAANFDKQSRAASDTLRVAAPLEIDSLRPKTVRYGEMLTIYGVGVDSIFSASLTGTPLIPVPYSQVVFSGGTARSKWWVPPPAHTDSLFFLGISGANGLFGYFRGDTTKVVEHDLYEPDDTIPQVINLDAPPLFSQAPQIVFFNPALAFEPLARGQVLGVDWYRFTQAETRDLTIIITAPQVKGTYVTYLTDSLAWVGGTQKFTIGSNSWSFGPSSHFCHGLPFAPGEAVGDSVIVAFKGLRAGSLDALSGYGVAGRYGLGVIAGYQSELPADRHEDDNSCNAADQRDTVPAPFRDTLAIENPHDVDWLRFHYANAGVATSAQVRMHAFPSPSSATPDSAKDLDLYVIKAPLPGDPALQIMLADTASGSDVNRTVNLATGDYYLVVVDYAGKSTYYEVCVGATGILVPPNICSAGFPAPPITGAPRTAAARRAPALLRSRP